MKIYRNNYNTPQMQIEENKKNIELLASYLKESYHTNEGVELNTSSISVAKSLTNADQDVVDGWLLDSVGSLFKITGGDDSSLLIEFYSSFRGEQGEQGEQGNDGANGLSIRYYNGIYINSSTNYSKSDLSNINNIQVGDIVLFKDGTLGKIQTITTLYFNVSSSHTNLEIQSTSKGYYYAKVQPTTSGDNLIYAKTSIFNGLTPCVFATGDMITYIDSNDNPNELYQVTGFSGDNLIVELKGTFAKGKQLYQHNFALMGSRYAGGDYHYLWCGVSFTSDDNTPITSYPLLKAYLINKGYTSSNNMLMSVNGISKNTGANMNLWVVGIFYNQTEDRLYCKRTDYNNTQTDWWASSDIDESNMNDDPKAI